MRYFRKSATQLPLVSLSIISILFTGCSTIRSTVKAPITELHTGGTVKERKQQYILKRIKWEHRSSHGQIVGANFFTDAKRPISGVRKKDTLSIESGPFAGRSFTVKKVWRILKTARGKRKRQVILELTSNIISPEDPIYWEVAKEGRTGVGLKERKFTDREKFLDEMPVGTQLRIFTNGQWEYYTIIGSDVVKLKGVKLQRVAYVLDRQPPLGLKNLRYQVRVPKAKISSNIKYRIYWRGSALTGYNFSIGINRRRYRQNEIEDLLMSNPASKKQLSAVKTKRGFAIVFQVTGGVAVVLGGFLLLVRRDDFTGSLIAVPLSILGGGLAFLAASIPFNVSANRDYLRAAEAYNKDILKRLRLKPDPELMSGKRAPQTERLATPPPAAKGTIYSKE